MVVRFPRQSGESQLRFAVPARIALQGGERASAVANIRDRDASGPTSPFLNRASDRRCPCPSQEESDFGACLAGSNLPGLRINPRHRAGSGFLHILIRQNTRTRTFLRNLLTITRNLCGVNEKTQRFSAVPELHSHPRNFHIEFQINRNPERLVDRMHGPGAVDQGEIGLAAGA